jgi:hypothetical protein
VRTPGERGIALPLTLFIVTLLTVTLAAAFARIAADRAIGTGSDQAVTALTVAQTGLARYLAYRTTRPGDGDSLRFNVTGGYADVVARIIRAPDTTRITYVLRSTGYLIVPRLGAATQARRTVAQFATWGMTPIRRIAAYVAANGVSDGPGGRIDISGADDCGTDPPIGSVRGSSGSHLTRGSYSPTEVIAGSPGAVADTAGIDTTAITDGAFIPDYRYAAGYTFTAADSGYASRVVGGDATINNVTGTGLLVVRGDLTLTGAAAGWKGIVLVWGLISFDRGTDGGFSGIVITGLGRPPFTNTRLGGPGGGQYVFHYSSCDVNRTLAAIGGLVPLDNAWVDNWASY